MSLETFVFGAWAAGLGVVALSIGAALGYGLVAILTIIDKALTEIKGQEENES